MSFTSPPLPDDVEGDFGEYNVDEIITARACLIHTVQKESAMVWHGLKYKMGILPNGQRLRVHDSPHMWIPDPLPTLWSAPVVLYDPVTGKTVDGAEESERSEESYERFQVVLNSDDGQREVRKEKGKTLSNARSSSSSSRRSDTSSEKSCLVVDLTGSSPSGSSSEQPGLSSDAISRSSQQAERKATQSSGQKRRQGDSETDSAATATTTSKRQKIHPESASAVPATTAAGKTTDTAATAAAEGSSSPSAETSGGHDNFSAKTKSFVSGVKSR